MSLTIKSQIARGLVRRKNFLIMAISFLMSTGVLAEELGLNGPLTMKDGEGIAILSFTIRGDAKAVTTVDWRSLDGNGLDGTVDVKDRPVFANEEFSKTSRHVRGRFVMLKLPKGNYEFFKYKSWGNGSEIRSRHDFSRRFNIKPGEVQYIGSLDVFAPRVTYGGGAIVVGLILGGFWGTVDVYSSISDEWNIDKALLVSRNFDIDKVVKNVAENEEDVRALAVLNDVKVRAEAGEILAQSQLMRGLIDGVMMTESGETFKVLPDAVLGNRIAEQLSAKGLAGGNFYIAESLNPLLNDKVSVSPEEGVRILNRYLSDAGSYYWPAVARVADIYDKGIPGVPVDGSLSNAWEKRKDAIKMPTVKAVPYVDDAGRNEFQDFLNASLPRFFALSESGAFGFSQGEDATAKAAIASCEKRNLQPGHCRLYAQDRDVVWNACPAEQFDSTAMTFPVMDKATRLDEMTPYPMSLTSEGRVAYRKFLASLYPRAIAISESGEAVMASGDCHAAYNALKKCSIVAGKMCDLYAVDDQKIVPESPPGTLQLRKRVASAIEQELRVDQAGLK